MGLGFGEVVGKVGDEVRGVEVVGEGGGEGVGEVVSEVVEVELGGWMGGVGGGYVGLRRGWDVGGSNVFV